MSDTLVPCASCEVTCLGAANISIFSQTTSFGRFPLDPPTPPQNVQDLNIDISKIYACYRPVFYSSHYRRLTLRSYKISLLRTILTAKLSAKSEKYIYSQQFSTLNFCISKKNSTLKTFHPSDEEMHVCTNEYSNGHTKWPLFAFKACKGRETELKSSHVRFPRSNIKIARIASESSGNKTNSRSIS